MRTILILLLTTTSLAAAPDTCAIEKSVYRLKTTPDAATLRFPKAAKPNAWSLLGAELVSAGTGRTYTFSYTASNGYSTEYLERESPKPARKDEPGHPIYFFTADLTAVRLPQPGEPAPRYLFLPDLGKRLYYGSPTADPKAKREDLATELWILTECR